MTTDDLKTKNNEVKGEESEEITYTVNNNLYDDDSKAGSFSMKLNEVINMAYADSSSGRDEGESNRYFETSTGGIVYETKDKKNDEGEVIAE